MKVHIKEINTDLDGFDIYSAFNHSENCALLDSGRDFDSLGRYSFIGINPFITIKSIDGGYLFNGEKRSGDILTQIREVLEKYKTKPVLDIPLSAGGIGYFSYDFCRKFEESTNKLTDETGLPEVHFCFYDNIIIVDNLLKKVYITALGILKGAEECISEIESKINSATAINYEEVKKKDNIFVSNFTEDEYISAVDKIKDYIVQGDVYIANLTQQYKCTTKRQPYDIYKDLRNINPSPFAAFINFEDYSIISSSPERFMQVASREVETRPIKGTRPRGTTLEEDLKFREELLNSEKDKAELLMIVDLERNDLSKICKPNSVVVTELFKLEAYSTVFHLVSTVVGSLKDGKDALSCIENCTPGGSITGAPKVRSMEIIEELEGVKRNIYTGSIGYLSFDGNMDLNIAIRTILLKAENAWFGVGGGITFDSDSKAEYDETLDKAKALMRVL